MNPVRLALVFFVLASLCALDECGREIEVKSSNEASSIDLKNGEIGVKVTTPCCIPNDDCFTAGGQLGHSECLTNKRCYLSSDCSGGPRCPPC